MIKRISGRHRGLKEDNLLRLVNAFALCHLSYAVSMHNWLKSEWTKLDAIVKKTVKKALGLPIRTRTENLLKLGVHNSAAEIAEAQERSQLARLSGTTTGRRILAELGLNPTSDSGDDYARIPKAALEEITVAPIPRNIHPVHNEGRRTSRAKSLLKQLGKNGAPARFVDAAAHKDGKKYAVAVVDPLGSVTNCATVITSKPEIAEQVAIALALIDDRCGEVYSDSKTAIRK